MKKYLLASIFSTLVFGQNDFSLEDINPLSDTYEQLIGPSYFAENLVVLGFFHEYWGSCRARFGLLNDIYLDLVSENIEDVKIIGIGKDQYISSLGGMINDRVLPWVQDSNSSDLPWLGPYSCLSQALAWHHLDSCVLPGWNQGLE